MPFFCVVKVREAEVTAANWAGVAALGCKRTFPKYSFTSSSLNGVLFAVYVCAPGWRRKKKPMQTISAMFQLAPNLEINLTMGVVPDMRDRA